MRTSIVFVLVLGVAACERRPSQPHLRLAAGPEPTEHWLDERAETDNHLERERWIEELHRAPPDVDWRAIERANGEREQARRNALGAAGLKAGGSKWAEVGSSNQAGRMHVARLSPDRTRLYSGSSLGGLWQAAPDGTGWTPLGDNLYGGVYDLEVLPGEHAGDPDVLVCRTGNQVLKVTRDLGLTWELPQGLTGMGLQSLRSMAVLDTTPPTLVVCAQYTGIGSAGTILVSTDYGRTFSKRWQSTVAGNAWMWVPRRGAGTTGEIWLARKDEILHSVDGGWSFQLVGAIGASVTDVRLTGSEAGAPTLYAMGQVSGSWILYRSDDAGVSFAQVHTPGEFWGSLCASSVDPMLVLYGGVEAHRSINGGASFGVVNGWGQYYGNPAIYLHADIQGIGLAPDPADPQAETWYVCNDGGIYQSTDGVKHVQNLGLSGLGVSQYYSTLTSRTDTRRILAGSQDQGYQSGYLEPSSGPGPSTPFVQRVSGDYGHLTSGDGTTDLVYSTYPGFLLISEGSSGGTLYSSDFPSTSHSWLPPVTADPWDRNAVFFCGDRLWRYARSGNSWTPTQYSTQDFTAGGAAYLSALAFAPSDPLRAYAVTNNGLLYSSTDHGLSWQVSSSTGPSQHYFYGNAIDVNPANALEAVVGGSGYGGGGVVRTTDGGTTWVPESTGLPSTLVYDLTYAPDGSGDVYAATEAGAWRWTRSAGTWSNIMSNEAPLTLYWSVEAVEPNIVRFGTYGRGIWDYELFPTPGWSTYGTGKLSSTGSTPFLTASGQPLLSTNDFSIDLFAAVPGKYGILMSSTSPASVPFQGGTLLVGAPITRGPAYVLDGLGLAHIPMPVSLELVGTEHFYQAWFRDPAHPDGTGIGLSDGMDVTYGP